MEMIVSGECSYGGRIIHTDEDFDLIPFNKKSSNIKITL